MAAGRFAAFLATLRTVFFAAFFVDFFLRAAMVASPVLTVPVDGSVDQSYGKYDRGMKDLRRGQVLGLLAVACFSLTLPMTRIAVAELPPLVVGLGRELAAVFLVALWLTVVLNVGLVVLAVGTEVPP